MEILLINCSWNNRGDESAIRAMIDEIKQIYPHVKFNIITHATKYGLLQFPYSEKDVEITVIDNITKKHMIEIPLLLLSKGNLAVSNNLKTLIRCIKKADIVLHAPGGPSMGDLYPEMQYQTFYKFFLAKAHKKPYGFYAPSMGPFNSKLKNVLRRIIYNGSSLTLTRENVSAKYYQTLGCKKDVIVTADSALQHAIDTAKYQKQFNEYPGLPEFFKQYEKIVGITITPLDWHKKYKNNTALQSGIKTAFEAFIQYLHEKEYGVIFIPQLFGAQHDYDYMHEFMQENCFIVDEEHDCYFQQYLISKLYAVVGLRYHSNVFSAKMKTPFIPISYEQKTIGFARLAEMEDYCIHITDLSFDVLKDKFSALENHYNEIKQNLENINPGLIEKSSQSTKLLCELIESKK